MLSVKFISQRILFFCVAYLLLLGIFQMPLLQSGSAILFSKGAETFMSVCLPKGYVHLENIKPTGQPLMVRVLFGNKATVNQQMEAAKRNRQAEAALELKEFRIKYQEFFLVPVIFFFALVTITPVKWTIKLKNAGIGLLILLFLFWLKLLCYTLHYYAQIPLGVYGLNGLSAKFVAVVFGLKIGISFIIAVLVWLGVSLGRSDWRQMLNQFDRT